MRNKRPAMPWMRPMRCGGVLRTARCLLSSILAWDEEQEAKPKTRMSHEEECGDESTASVGGYTSIGAEGEEEGEQIPVEKHQKPKSHAIKCALCSNPALLRCVRCKITVYCSPICQKAHWKEHRQICAPLNLQTASSLAAVLSSTTKK